MFFYYSTKFRRVFPPDTKFLIRLLAPIPAPAFLHIIIVSIWRSVSSKCTPRHLCVLDRDIGLLFTTPARMPTYLSIQILIRGAKELKQEGCIWIFFSEPMQLRIWGYGVCDDRVRCHRNRVKFEYNEWLWIVIYKEKKQKQKHWPQNWVLGDSITIYYRRIAGHWRCISFITHVDEGHYCRVILGRNPDWYLLAWRFHRGSFRGDGKTVFQLLYSLPVI